VTCGEIRRIKVQTILMHGKALLTLASRDLLAVVAVGGRGLLGVVATAPEAFALRADSLHRAVQMVHLHLECPLHPLTLILATLLQWWRWQW
jgi:hypothetical protein